MDRRSWAISRAGISALHKRKSLYSFRETSDMHGINSNVHGPSKLRRYVYDWSGGHGIVSSPGRHWRRMGSQTFINAVLRVRASCVIEHDANSQSAFRIYRRFLGISWCSYVLKLFLPKFSSCRHREKMFNAVSFTGTGIRLPYSTALIKSRHYHGMS